jgi:hypothetical protein
MINVFNGFKNVVLIKLNDMFTNLNWGIKHLEYLYHLDIFIQADLTVKIC